MARRSHGPRPRVLAAALLCAAAAPVASSGLGCAGDAESLAQRVSPVVYGTDDRRELFEVDDLELRALMSQSSVALIPRAALRRATGEAAVVVEAPSWGTVAALCPEERFADQPAAALCTGVLVDWDLVLTAGHCARRMPLDELAVVFGYTYAVPGALDPLSAADVFQPVAIVADALDPPDAEPRLDYAWLRIDRAATFPRQPAALHREPAPLAPGDAIVTIGASGGVPLKLDGGARVRDPRSEAADYFVANTDATAGASGGGAFDGQRVLTGILARGQPDLALTGDGCNVTVRLPDDLGDLDEAEELTYVHRALEGLCRREPGRSLCRPDCGEPCRALPPPPEALDGGCSVSGRCDTGGFAVGLALGLAIVALLGPRRCRQPARRRARQLAGFRQRPRCGLLSIRPARRLA